MRRIRHAAGYLRPCRRAYRSPAATLVLFAGSAVGILATCAFAAKLSPWENGPFFFFVIFCIPVLVSTAATSLFICLLPRRNPHVFGRRRPRLPFERIRVPTRGSDISFMELYERRMRRFNLAVILTALIALIILITSWFFSL